MNDIRDTVEEVRGEYAQLLNERLRERLLDQPTEWLVEQLLAQVTLSAPLTVGDIMAFPRSPEPETADQRAARRERIRALDLDSERLADLIAEYRSVDRADLETNGLLLAPPAKGEALLGARHRSPAGEALLTAAGDLLYALLFGDAADGVRLDRVERGLLTITVPRTKAATLGPLLRADTAALVDDRAANVLLRVEYGEVAGALVGHGIAAALRLVNNLELNEYVLYARMENVPA